MRSFDMERYTQLSRVVTGEMMTQAFAEWRSSYSHNQGALVWFLKDLWPARVGESIDKPGEPQSTLLLFCAACANPQLPLPTKGWMGFTYTIINETAQPIDGIC